MMEADTEVSVSAGMAAYPADGRDPEALLMKADRRLDRAKRVRPGGLRVGVADLLAAGEALG